MEQPQNLSSNIWKYAILLTTNKRVFAAIIGAYYLTIPSTTAQTIGLILLIGNIAGFLFEIPSGYLSDKIGHKQTLVWSRVAIIISTAFFLFADSVTFLILGSVFLSISQAFLSGTGSAFMHETMQALGREDEYTKVMGKISSFGFGVPIFLSISAPFLVAISFKAPFILSLIIDVIGLIATISLVVPKVKLEHVEEVNATNFRQVMQEGYKLGFFKHATFIAITAGVLFGIGTFRSPYQMLLGIPVIWFGVLFGAGRGLASLLLYYSGYIKKLFPDKLSFYRFEIILYCSLIFLLAASTNIFVIATLFIILNGVQWGLTQISHGHMMDVIKGSKFKATLLSVKAQGVNLISAFIGFGMGYVIDKTSYRTAYFYLGSFLLISLLLMYWYISRQAKIRNVDL